MIWYEDRGWVLPDGTSLVPDRARRYWRQRLDAAYRLHVIGGGPPVHNYR